MVSVVQTWRKKKSMQRLPETGFLRLSQIIGNSKATPPIPPLIPVCKSTWWEGVKEGHFPKPVKIGQRCTCWRVEDIRNLILKVAGGKTEHAA